jgi:hypothetical protein
VQGQNTKVAGATVVAAFANLDNRSARQFFLFKKDSRDHFPAFFSTSYRGTRIVHKRIINIPVYIP